MSWPDMGKRGAWRELFPHALTLMTHLETQIRQPWWTFGGGTVLMLRIGHRQSKDIDLFVPDPQYLGYLNPRLSDTAEQITADRIRHADGPRGRQRGRKQADVLPHSRYLASMARMCASPCNSMISFTVGSVSSMLRMPPSARMRANTRRIAPTAARIAWLP